MPGESIGIWNGMLAGCRTDQCDISVEAVLRAMSDDRGGSPMITGIFCRVVPIGPPKVSLIIGKRRIRWIHRRTDLTTMNWIALPTSWKD